jgi:hypothetical protein
METGQMQVRTPGAYPREDGKFAISGNGGSGNPWAMIELDEGGDLGILLESPEECDLLITAACAAKDEIIRRRALRDGPHPFRATTADRPCLDCGNDSAAEIHTERAAAHDQAVRQAAYFAQPGNTIDDLLADQAAGQ